MSRQSLERSLPHNIDAEKAILGAILVDNEQAYAVSERLKPNDFYLGSHRHIYRISIEMIEKSKPVDLVTIQDELLRQEKFEASGGIGYLASLLDGIPAMANIAHYVEMVHDLSISRQLIHTTNQIMAACFDGVLSGKELLEEAETQLLQLGEARLSTGLKSTSELQVETIQRVEKAYNERDMITGLSTGFRDLDRMTAGLQAGNLVILAARPGVGKSALATNIAQWVAHKDEKTVAIFSLEMTEIELMLRMATSEGRVDGQKLRSGYIGKDDFRKLIDAIDYLGKQNIHIDDSSTLTAMDIRSRCRRLKAERGLHLVIVDYLQLMSGPPSKRQENRTQEISSITRSLKGLAKDLNVPVLALSQLNRSPETRKGSARPILSDLRESGSIEQDADMVAFIYREELYKPAEDNAGHAEIIIAKQRNGPIGTVHLAFLKEYTKFENLFIQS